MVKLKSNIIIIGLGNSGSSAIQDLLLEYDNIGKFRYEEIDWSTGELNHFRLPGMIGDRLSELSDLENPNNLELWLKENKRPIVPSSLYFRFFIPDAIYNLYKENKFTRKFAKIKISEWREQQKYYDSLVSINYELSKTKDYDERMKIAKGWLEELRNIFGKDKPFMQHKPIFHERHLNIWPTLFDPFKVIMIFREPRDQLATVLKSSVMFRHTDWKYHALFGMDKGNRRLFHALIETTYMRALCIDEMEKRFGPSKFLKLDFEGLISNYDQYKAIIENFLEIGPLHHVKPKAYFDPKVSINSIKENTSLLDSSDEEYILPLEKWYQQKLKEVKESLNIY